MQNKPGSGPGRLQQASGRTDLPRIARTIASAARFNRENGYAKHLDFIGDRIKEAVREGKKEIRFPVLVRHDDVPPLLSYLENLDYAVEYTVLDGNYNALRIKWDV